MKTYDQNIRRQNAQAKAMRLYRTAKALDWSNYPTKARSRSIMAAARKAARACSLAELGEKYVREMVELEGKHRPKPKLSVKRSRMTPKQFVGPPVKLKPGKYVVETLGMSGPSQRFEMEVKP